MPTTFLRRAVLSQIFPDTTPPSQNCKKKLRGTKAPNPPKARPSLAIYNSEPENIKPAAMLKAMEKMSSEVGDSEKLTELQSKLAGAKKARQDIVNDYLDRKRRYGMAEQQQQRPVLKLNLQNKSSPKQMSLWLNREVTRRRKQIMNGSNINSKPPSRASIPESKTHNRRRRQRCKTSGSTYQET